MTEPVQLILMFIFIPIALLIINLFLPIRIAWSLIISYLIMFFYSMGYNIILIIFSPLISLFASAVVFSVIGIVIVEFISYLNE